MSCKTKVMPQFPRGSASKSNSPEIVFVVAHLLQYHRDRFGHLAGRLGSCKVLSISIAGSSNPYSAFEDVAESNNPIRHHTLFPGEMNEAISAPKKFWRLLRECVRSGARKFFLTNYERPEIFATAVILRLLGKQVFIMQDSKFDDKPRYLLRELGKALLYSPYSGAIVGGKRSHEYLEFLGMSRRPIAVGLDTISVQRVRENAAKARGKQEVDFHERSFVVIARLIPEKNLFTLLDAYKRYREIVCSSPRDLSIWGAGPLLEELENYSKKLGLHSVHFHGWADAHTVASQLSQALALILPSSQETFGLVVNEAIALRVPLIVSRIVGAVDILVREGENGFIIDPYNTEGFARAMAELTSNPSLWQRMSESCQKYEQSADVVTFENAIRQLVNEPV